MRFDIMWSEFYKFAEQYLVKMYGPGSSPSRIATDYSNYHPIAKCEKQGCKYEWSNEILNKIDNFLDGDINLVDTMLKSWNNFDSVQENRHMAFMVKIIREMMGKLDNYISYVGIRNYASPNTTITFTFNIKKIDNSIDINFNEVCKKLACVIDSIFPKDIFGKVVFTYDIHVVIMDTKIDKVKGFYSSKHDSYNVSNFFPDDNALTITSSLYPLHILCPYNKMSNDPNIHRGSIYDIRVAIFVAKMFIFSNSQKTDTYIDNYLKSNFKKFTNDYTTRSQEYLSGNILRYFGMGDQSLFCCEETNHGIFNEIIKTLPESENDIMKRSSISTFFGKMYCINRSPFTFVDESLQSVVSPDIITDSATTVILPKPNIEFVGNTDITISNNIIPNSRDIYRNYLISIFNGNHNMMDELQKQEIATNINIYFKNIDPNIRYNNFEELIGPFYDNFTIWIDVGMQYTYACNMPKL